MAEPFITSSRSEAVLLILFRLSTNPPSIELVCMFTVQSEGTMMLIPPKIHSISSMFVPGAKVVCVRSSSVPPKTLDILPPLNSPGETLCFPPPKTLSSTIYPSSLFSSLVE